MSALQTELTDDPLTRGYAGMTDQQAADDLNTEYRPRNRITMSGSEVYQAVDNTEFAALTATEQQEVWNILHLGDQINPFGKEESRFIALFGGGSVTIVALAAARVENITRASELGIRVSRSAVEGARA